MQNKYPIEVMASGLNFPEGPAVDGKGQIWFVEVKGGNLCCLQHMKVRRIATNGAPNGIAIGADDSIWFCDSKQNQIRRYLPEEDRIVVEAEMVDDEVLSEPNDLAFDQYGHLCFTCPGNSRVEPVGYSCCLQADRSVKKIATRMYFNNGLAFTPDGNKLVIAETYRHRLWIGNWNPVSLSWENPHPWVEVGGPVGPDGMAFAENGNLYVAVFGQQAIKSVSPSGEIVEVIELPGKNPTNCAFLPQGGLLVTEAETGQLLLISNGVSGARLFQ